MELPNQNQSDKVTVNTFAYIVYIDIHNSKRNVSSSEQKRNQVVRLLEEVSLKDMVTLRKILEKDVPV